VIEDVLQKYGPIGVEVVKMALEKVRATGKTIDSVGFFVDSDSHSYNLVIYAREFTQLLESGRRPTTKGPSPDMIKELTEYAKARGMDKPESAAWAIAITINKKGDATFRQGGRNVYSEELEKFVDELKLAIKKDFLNSWRLEIKKALNVNRNQQAARV
jgi:hypothetical protein